MTRQEYLEQMQTLREQLQQNAMLQRENLDTINDEYREALAKMNEKKRADERKLRNTHTENQHQIEKQMHELKVQWAKEHPVGEVKVIE